MSQKELDTGPDTPLSPAMQKWLKTIAETCILHMKYIENHEKNNPEALTTEDYGILELERGFLTLYSLHITGKLPPQDS